MTMKTTAKTKTKTKTETKTKMKNKFKNENESKNKSKTQNESKNQNERQVKTKAKIKIKMNFRFCFHFGSHFCFCFYIFFLNFFAFLLTECGLKMPQTVNCLLIALKSMTNVMGKTAIWTICVSLPFPFLTMLRNNERSLRQAMLWVRNIVQEERGNFNRTF